MVVRRVVVKRGVSPGVVVLLLVAAGVVAWLLTSGRGTGAGPIIDIAPGLAQPAATEGESGTPGEIAARFRAMGPAYAFDDTAPRVACGSGRQARPSPALMGGAPWVVPRRCVWRPYHSLHSGFCGPCRSWSKYPA